MRSVRARIVLFAMPFGPAVFPSLGLGLIKPILQRAGFDVVVRYEMLRFAELLGHDAYERIALAAPSELVGDRVFAASLHGRSAERARLAPLPVREGAVADVFARAVRLAPAWIDDIAAEIAADAPAAVGFTSTFAQHAASLALARAIKERNGAIGVVFGGANCEGEMGRELLRRFPFVDAVVSGEGERVAAATFAEVISGKRSGARDVVVADAAVDLDELPLPDFDEYFDAIERIDPDGRLPRSIIVEGSRGCWWGAKHHCTFCGLNGATMAFRSKSPARFADEIAQLSQRYGTADAMTADNIIDHRYYDTLLPELASRALRVRLFFEIKANVKRRHVEALQAAAVVRVQPGIESLDDHVLALMRKGVSALQNIQTLKLCKEHGIGVSWNLLTGFPNEDPAAYARMARLIPLLTHLPPPEVAAAIRMDRFSPFFDDAERFGMVNVRPAAAYAGVYGGTDESLSRLAYYFTFDYADGRNVASYTSECVAAVQRWREEYADSDLCTMASDDDLLVVDRRRFAPRPFSILSGVERAVYAACEDIADTRAVVAAVSALHPVAADEVLAACARLTADGLMLEEHGRYLALAVPLERAASDGLRAQLTAAVL